MAAIKAADRTSKALLRRRRQPLHYVSMLHGWDNFFILAGSAAATLMGLLFVAITAGTGFSASQIVQGTRGFLTPTLVHFGSVLFLTLMLRSDTISLRCFMFIISRRYHSRPAVATLGMGHSQFGRQRAALDEQA